MFLVSTIGTFKFAARLGHTCLFATGYVLAVSFQSIVTSIARTALATQSGVTQSDITIFNFKCPYVLVFCYPIYDFNYIKADA